MNGLPASKSHVDDRDNGVGLIARQSAPIFVAFDREPRTIASAVDSAVFTTSSDALIARSGAVFQDTIVGDGASFEASGGGQIAGLRVAGQISGAVTVGFSGFAVYQFDTGGRWTLTGVNAIAAGQSLTTLGRVANAGTLSVGGWMITVDRSVSGAGQVVIGDSGGAGCTRAFRCAGPPRRNANAVAHIQLEVSFDGPAIDRPDLPPGIASAEFVVGDLPQ
jgi:hypothetical protein